jgi:hypothetical protein
MVAETPSSSMRKPYWPSVDIICSNESTYLDFDLVVVATKHFKGAVFVPPHNVIGVEHHGSVNY